MNDYLTEQEQIQQLKTWVKQYGPTVLAGILIALLVAGGWRYWQSYRNKELTHASVIYDEMLTSRAQNNAKGAAAQAKKLLRRYDNTPYASMAAFMLAREAVLKKNYDEAIKQLNWVMDHSKEDSMQEIARIRIARILIAQKKPDAALDLLKKVEDNNFIGLIDETKGDAYLAKNDISSARNAYQLALNETPNADVNRPMLQMKYNNLAPQNKAAS